MAKLRTAEEIKELFRARGETVSEWARAHNYSVHEVYRVLNGVHKGHRGKAHQIAVDLGLKAAPEMLAS